MADNNLSDFIYLNSDLINEIRRDVEYTNRVDFNYYNSANQTQLENEIKTYIDENCIIHDDAWNNYVYNVFEEKRPKVYNRDIEPVIRKAADELEYIICYDADFDKINWTKIEKKDSVQLKTIKLFFKLNYNDDE